MLFIFLSYLLEETCNKFHEEMNINERIQEKERERDKERIWTSSHVHDRISLQTKGHLQHLTFCTPFPYYLS